MTFKYMQAHTDISKNISGENMIENTEVLETNIPNLIDEDFLDAIQDRHSVLLHREDASSMNVLTALGAGMAGNEGIFSMKKITIDDLQNNPEFNWRVEKEPMSRHNLGRNRKIFTHSAITRTDTRKQIGLIRSSARVLQNNHLFEFVRPFVDSGSFEIDAVRSIDGGRSVVVVMKNTDLGVIEAFKGDPMEAFTMARLTRGSNPQINVGSLVWRLVCSNGMMGLGMSKHKIDAGSPIGLTGKNIAGILAGNAKQAKLACEKMVEMSKVPMSLAQNDEYFRRACNLAWNDPDLAFDCKEDFDEHQSKIEKSQMTINKIHDSTELMRETMSENRQNSLEQSWQGLTHYVSNKRSKSPDVAFRENNWGSGKRIRDRGFKMALDLIENGVIN